ncbi:bifunctional riboflavin kinase/FAD synthetase [Alphaproteobacteria bacterium KMM 3653]|uniref:Riboflavin biosynthesis protein n=1 Tax=Harenicola maris TaxID=2841044 RepID=A0AAP2CPI7_9RHOB|nr:bifunctional riboflavin kinase/FAD synthetase [Harenicola maris]
MRVIRSLSDLTQADRGATAGIGNFDGVHLGHQAVIAAARACDPAAPLAVVTFEPHPRQVFAPVAPAFRLMTPEARAHRLEKLGVDILFELPFDAAMRERSADAFAREVLVEGLGLTCAAVGADFHFGKGRTGSAETLRDAGADLGFAVQVVDLVAPHGTEVSSTAIRGALTAAQPGMAAAMLGHWHRIEGPVIHGHKRGRELGYPTANMGLDGLHLPALGVYAVQVRVEDGPDAGEYGGVAALGVRPMFGENTPNLETFLFDFEGDLYGRQLSVALVEYLRPEAKFDGLEALITQMDADSAQARAVLAALP